MKPTATPRPCECGLEPVYDAIQRCDLCSEATGAFNGVGWRIAHCAMHVRAVNVESKVRELVDAMPLAEWIGDPEFTPEQWKRISKLARIIKAELEGDNGIS